METPKLERFQTGGSDNMGEGEGQEPSVGRRDGDREEKLAGQEGELLRQPDGVVVIQRVEETNLPEVEIGDYSRAVDSNTNIVDTNLNETAGTSDHIQNVNNDAGPSSPKLGTSGEPLDNDNTIHGLDERRSGGEGGGASFNSTQEGDPLREQQEANDAPLQVGGTAAGAEAAGLETTTVQHYRTSSTAFGFPPRFLSLTDKTSEAHLIDIPLRLSSKVEELDSYKRFAVARTLSNFSRASVESAAGDQCRICQQHTEEPLMELGCQCRGELAKSHLSCVNHWFGNKGTNKCEVCQHVATNVPLPSSQSTPHFWVWRVGGSLNSTARRGQGARFHPLWAALLILIAGLLFDILISIFLGASALPVNIIIVMLLYFNFLFIHGVLVVLGLGTAARLILECWHERVIRRNIQRMEREATLDDFSAEQNNVDIEAEPGEGQEFSDLPHPSPGGPPVQASAEASVTASVAASATPDVLSR